MKQNYKEKIRTIFNSDFCGMQDFVSYVLEPIFGDGILYPAPQTIDYKKDIVKNVVCVGEIMGLYSNPILIYEVTLSDSCNIGRSRVYIQDAVRSDMLAYTNAFIVFHYENMTNRSWRFSFAQKEATKSAMKTAKRYTYLVGKGYSCRTIADRFANLYENKDTLTQESFLQAFSVEALSKEFFNEYTSFYNDFVNYVTNDDVMFPRFLNVAKKDTLLAEKYVRDYIKKLMGRLVFIQFLQKKGWLCNDLNYLQTLFASSTKAEKANFLDNVLEPMFFGVFNTDVKDRKDLFEKKKWNLNLLKKWNSFPYLNGGLFESDELDDLKLPIPGYFFSNPEKKDVVRKPDDNYYEDSCGLLDFFERYNFTIDENDPDDAEVGVDPEMLGKIFENLLEDNKDKGAFYTPKEIVQYMCQESIVQYLKTHTKESLHPAIEELIKEKNVNKLIQNKAIAKTVYTLLHDVKVCDPAIGSGAFPMGILNELYRARVLLYGFTDPINDFSPSNIKREIIQNNIYGVDIEKGAIDIARLRFWLSIVVDSEEPEPLPNFDYKFMQGNSLLEQFEGVDLSRIYDKPKYAEQISMAFDDETDAKDELWRNMIEYFSVTDHKHKQHLRNNIGDSVRKLLWAKASKTEIREKISSIDPIANQNFFLWHTWFADVFENGGFDIVIGNPPYLRIQGIRESNPELAEFLSKHFESATGSFDLYVTFVERGLNLISPNGIVNYIMPTKWTNSAFGKGLRKLVSKAQSASQIINFGAYQVFNASTYTGLQWFTPNSECLKYFELDRDLSSNEELSQYLNSLSDEHASMIDSWKLSDSQWVLTNNKIAMVLDQLNKHPRRIKDVFDKIFQGIATSKDDVYFIYNCIIDDNYIVGESKQLGRIVQIERGLVKPLLKGEDVHRYDTIKTDRYVIFPYKIQNGKALLYTESELEELYPKGFEYLKECENVLREREKGRFNIDGEWFQFGRKQGILYAEKEKLVAPDISMGGNFAYDCQGEFYQTTTIYGYIKKQNVQESYKFWMALLNSRLFWWYLVNTGTVLANGFFRFKPDYVNPFPVPGFDITCKVQTIICQLVDFLIFLKNPENKNVLLHTSNDRIMAHISEIIDLVIYELYFEQHMKDNNLDVISFLKSYPWNCNIVDMSEDIEKFYLWYQQSDNPIRQRSMLLETRSKNLLYLIHKNQLLYEQNQ